MILRFARAQRWSVRPASAFRSPALTGYLLARLPRPRGLVFNLNEVDAIVAAAPRGVDLMCWLPADRRRAGGIPVRASSARSAPAHPAPARGLVAAHARTGTARPLHAAATAARRGARARRWHGQGRDERCSRAWRLSASLARQPGEAAPGRRPRLRRSRHSDRRRRLPQVRRDRGPQGLPGPPCRPRASRP